MYGWWYGSSAATTPTENKPVGTTVVDSGWVLVKEEEVPSEAATIRHLADGTLIEEYIPQQSAGECTQQAPPHSNPNPTDTGHQHEHQLNEKLGESPSVFAANQNHDSHIAQTKQEAIGLNIQGTTQPDTDDSASGGIVQLQYHQETLRLGSDNDPPLHKSEHVTSSLTRTIRKTTSNINHNEAVNVVPAQKEVSLFTVASLITLVACFILAVGSARWYSLLSFLSSIASTVLVMMGVVIMPTYLFPRAGQSISLVLTWGVGYAFCCLNFSFIWILAFGVANFLSLFFIKRSEIVAGREWFNIIVQTILHYATGLKVTQFDIGSVPPRVTLATINESPSNEGFEMTICYEYPSDETTKVEIEIPVTLPALGQITVPVYVASPRLAGKVHLDCRIGCCEFEHLPLNQLEKQTSNEKFMAIAVNFEPVEEIHIGDIRISVASKFQWLQWFNIVKSQMKSFFNALLASDSMTIYVFDERMTMIGSVVHTLPPGIQRTHAALRQLWSLESIVRRVRTCSTCMAKVEECKCTTR